MGDSPVNCGLTNHSLMGERIIAMPITVLYKGGLNAITYNSLWTPYFFPLHGAVDSYGHFKPDDSITYSIFREVFPEFKLSNDYLVGSWEEGQKTLWYVGEDVYEWCLNQMPADVKKIRENAQAIDPFLQSRDYCYRANKYSYIEDDFERYNLIDKNRIDDRHWLQYEWDISRFLRYNIEMISHLAAGIENFYNKYDENIELDAWFREEVIKQYIFVRFLPYIRRTIHPNHSTGVQYETYQHLKKFDSFVAKRSQELYKATL